jgi:hypothetical protein
MSDSARRQAHAGKLLSQVVMQLLTDTAPFLFGDASDLPLKFPCAI